MRMRTAEEKCIREEMQVGGFLENFFLELWRYGAQIARDQRHHLVAIAQQKHLRVQWIVHAGRGLALARAITGQWHLVSLYVRRDVSARHTYIEGIRGHSSEKRSRAKDEEKESAIAHGA